MANMEKSFERHISIDATGKKVFDSINEISLWWTAMFEGIADKRGEQFTVRFGVKIFKTLLVEELIPNKRIVWYVTDSLIDIPGLSDKTEWIGTKIIWDIYSQGTKTELQLTHIGLTPAIECYTIRESGWNGFTDSLIEFIKTGIGKPYNSF